ncbi:MAG: DUF4097 family beta strand repeat-containing protein [Thermoplasmatota archaeon]
MEPSFFRSREFVVAAVVAGLVVGIGLALAFSPALGGPLSTQTTDCAREARGTLLVANVTSENDTFADGARRIVTYTLDARALSGGDLEACTTTGHVSVAPASAKEARVVFTIRSSAADARAAVDATRVEARFARSGGSLGVAAFQATAASGFGMLSGGASVDIDVELPADGAYNVTATTDTGAVSLAGLLVKDVSLSTATGSVSALDLDAQGNVTASTATGRIDVALKSVESGNVSLVSSTGHVSLALPRRADIGYDVSAATSTGSVRVDVGPTELSDSKHDGAGGSAHERTKDFYAQPTRVTVRAKTATGGVDVASA